MPAKQPPAFLAQRKLLITLGERLRLARLRRRLAIDITCQRAGISRMTLFRIESGSPSTAIGTLGRLLAVLGLEADLDLIARDDKLGRLLQDQALAPRRRRAARARAKAAAPPERAP
ncbi:MAG: helix-turn-helix domain-containing protein [Terriglobales bacterium]